MMRSAAALFALAVLLSASCGPGAVDFPIGFFGVEGIEQARLLAGKSYNAIQPYGMSPEKLREFSRTTPGVLMLVSPDALMVTTHTSTEFPGFVWFLKDEPDVHGLDREALRALEMKVRAWSPGAKTAFVVGDGRKAKNYPGVADVVMVDWYPVPHKPLETAGDNVRMTAEVGGGRRVWAVLQAMDWRDYPRENPRGIGRFPTQEEIRFMSYDSVLNGAQGIWYFTFSTSPGTNLAQAPARLYAVDSVAREMREMSPIFASGRSIPLPFSPPKEGWLARAWTYHGRDYIVMANRTKDRQWKVPEEALTPTWRPLFEVRRDPRELLTPFGKSYYLKPYQVLVLESRLRPKRFLGL